MLTVETFLNMSVDVLFKRFHGDCLNTYHHHHLNNFFGIYRPAGGRGTTDFYVSTKILRKAMNWY